MRIFTLLFLLFITATEKSFSQEIKFPTDSLTGKIKFTEVIYVDSATRSTLYTKAREWFVKSFQSSKSVLELEDKEAGKLIGKGNISVITEESVNENEYVKMKGLIPKKLRDQKTKGEAGTVSFTIAIYIKEGRFKYEVTGLYHKGNSVTVNGYTATVPDGGDLSNSTPSCGYGQMMPKIRWTNIRTETFNTIVTLIKNLKTTMIIKDKTEDF